MSPFRHGNIVFSDEEKFQIINGIEQDIFRFWPKQLEEALIKSLLETNDYQYIKITNEQELKENLKRKIEELNRKDPKKANFYFFGSEWDWFYREHFEGADNEGYKKRTRKIQAVEFRKILKQHNQNTTLNIDLLDKKNIHNNSLQIASLNKDDGDSNKKELAILVNGLPLVFIEIQPRIESLQDVFNSDRVNNESFFSKLFEFVQIFVISNGIETKYYGNTIRWEKDKQSFQRTSYWSTLENEPIKNLVTFGKTFLNKNTILQMLTKYCVFDTNQVMKVLRPYQIAAIEGIVSRVKKAVEDDFIEGIVYGGYVWHTTGSGKTLTSFKASKIINEIENIDKVIFVVDRKSLDSQTTREYKNFLGEGEEKTIDSTSNVETLKMLLEAKEKKIIITTVQKLRKLIFKERVDQTHKEERYILSPECFKKRVVIIMDECHRSQTEKLHGFIRQFKKRAVFGFTGTPLIKKGSENENINETEILFGGEIHAYKIIDAINDENVLPFWVDYVHTRQKLAKPLKENDIENPERIASVVKYIIRHFEKKTNPSSGNSDSPEASKPRFNSIFAVKSVPVAIDYYNSFKQQLEEANKDLKVAIIYCSNDKLDDEDEEDDLENLEEDEKGLSINQKQFLTDFIKGDYQKIHKLPSSTLDKYRVSVSDNVKDKVIDILIVVNMFLTGFDAETLNTLWIDKYLTSHNLIQAFSRTNRIFGKSKPQGNIVCFREMKAEVDDALITFAGKGGEESLKTILVPTLEEKREEFAGLETRLQQEFPLGCDLDSDYKKKEFVKTWKRYMTLANSLSCDEDFQKYRQIAPEQVHDYQGMYWNVYDNYKTKREKRKDTFFDEDIISFDLELACCNQVDVDYIVSLLAEYAHKKTKNRIEIMRYVRTNTVLRKEADIIEDYLDAIDNNETQVDYKEFRKQKLDQLIDKTAEEESLVKEPFRKFVYRSLEKNYLSFDGSNFRTQVMPKMDLVRQWREYKMKCEKIEELVRMLFEKFRSWQ